jgi:DNA mismatch endonuclease, patch repair protein
VDNQRGSGLVANRHNVRASPSFKGLRPASALASCIGRAASRKSSTPPELLLRRALRKQGVSHKVCVDTLPGRPDIVVSSANLAIFCDGDFWHGRNLKLRLVRLASGHNAEYWVSKIKANVQRDRRVDRLLRKEGWTPLRFWESDLRADPDRAARIVIKAIAQVRRSRSKAGR